MGVRAGDETLLGLPADRLAYWTRIVGSTTPTTTLGPAQTAFVWLDVAINPDRAVPQQLTHAVAITVPRPMPPLFPGAMTEEIAPVAVQTR
ncbi:peptidase M23, partial [Mycobacterium sp. ITM-2017-0098]